MIAGGGAFAASRAGSSPGKAPGTLTISPQPVRRIQALGAPKNGSYLAPTFGKAEKPWCPRRDSNPFAVKENKGFFQSFVAGSGWIRCILDTGVHRNFQRRRAATSATRSLVPPPLGCAIGGQQPRRSNARPYACRRHYGGESQNSRLFGASKFLVRTVVPGARDGGHSSRVLGQHYLLPRVRDILEGRALVRTGPHANVASIALRTAAAA